MVSLDLAPFGLAPDARIVAGVSGGVDSVVLLRLLHEAGFRVGVAHVNYGLRGEESDADEAFVRALADELGVPCFVREATLPEGANRQEAAREARYAFFREVAEAEGAEAVAVGHTQDDQAETVLLHLFRGAGLRGLAGMPAERPLTPRSAFRLVRPLLGVPRVEVEAHARARGWAWREDASNASAAYRRNALRHRILPLLREQFGQDVSAHVAAAAGHVRTFLGAPEAPPALFARLRRGDRRLALDGLRALDIAPRRAVLLEALRAWAPDAPRNAGALAELAALVEAQPGRRVAWPGLTVWRDREALVFESAPAVSPREAWPVWPGVATGTPYGTLTLEPLGAVPSAVASGGPNVEVADADALVEPLVLRRWREGDRFRPLGLGGTKKVSDLLTERKVPPSEREHQLVLCAGDAVLWVVGYRLAEAARLRPETRRAVRLVWAPLGP